MGQIQRCKNHLVFRVVLCIQKLKNSSCVNVSQSTSAKLESKSVTPVGSYTALNMASSPMVICHQTKLLEMTPSKPSSQRLEVANTFPGLSLLTWNQMRLMKLDVELIASCIIPNNSLMARKMLLITMLVVTTPLERRLSILHLTSRIPSLPLFRWRYRIWICISSHGAFVCRLRQEIKTGIRHLPSSSSCHRCC